MFDPSMPGTCLQFAPVNYAISITAIVCDVTIFLLPIPLVQRLHLDRTVKIGLTIMFALGLLTTVLSILRATQIYRVQYGDGDPSFLVVRSGLELNIGVGYLLHRFKIDMFQRPGLTLFALDNHLLPSCTASTSSAHSS